MNVFGTAFISKHPSVLYLKQISQAKKYTWAISIQRGGGYQRCQMFGFAEQISQHSTQMPLKYGICVLFTQGAHVYVFHVHCSYLIWDFPPQA